MRRIVKYSNKIGNESCGNEFYNLYALANNIIQKVDNFDKYFELEFPYWTGKTITVVNDIDHMIDKTFDKSSDKNLKLKHDTNIIRITSYTNNNDIDGTIRLQRNDATRFVKDNAIYIIGEKSNSLSSTFYWRDNNYA